MAFSKTGLCPKGKPCSATCISRDYLCRVEFPKQTSSPLKKLRDGVSEKGADVADHIGKNVAAWKTGKLLGGAISAYLESRYGIPRESSVKLAETAIQGLAATGLDIKHLRNSDQVAKKLFTEIAAAFIGKTSHSGAEIFISSKEVSTMVETALPVLAGKISGIGTSLLSNRLPTPAQLVTIIQERSKTDMERVRNFLKPQVNFSEMDDIAEIIGDITVMVLVGIKGKIDRTNK